MTMHVLRHHRLCTTVPQIGTCDEESVGSLECCRRLVSIVKESSNILHSSVANFTAYSVRVSCYNMTYSTSRGSCRFPL